MAATKHRGVVIFGLRKTVCITEEHQKMLHELCNKMAMNESEIIRKAIEKLYNTWEEE